MVKVLQGSLVLLPMNGQYGSGHHLCGQVITELEDLKEKSSDKEKKHKEEGKGSIQSDAEENQKLQTALKDCIHPLDVEAHQSNMLVNIYTGEEASEDANVNKSIDIEIHQLMEFQQSRPESFRERLSAKLVIMAEGNKAKKFLLKRASTQS